MNYLIDTHIFLWAIGAPEKLSQRCQEILSDPVHDVYVSSVTSWEIAIKKSIGKLKAPDNINEIVFEKKFSELKVTLEHGDYVYKLPHHHKDPFDRMLIAQALVENFTIISYDEKFKLYDVDIWNGIE